MKKLLSLLTMLVGLLLSDTLLAQTDAPAQKLSVTDRMAKARAAKAEKKNSQPADTKVYSLSTAEPTSVKISPKEEKATAADYKAPVDKSKHGPNGEAVRTGERGGKYYINKNGNKTYIKSNQ